MPASRPDRRKAFRKFSGLKNHPEWSGLSSSSANGESVEKFVISE
jgi:hypothetical protein